MASSRCPLHARQILAKLAPADWLIAIGFTLAAEIEVLIRLPILSREQGMSAAAALALLGLGWWRRQPLVPSVLLAGAAIADVAAGARTPMAVPQLALFLATYSLGAYAGNFELGLGALLPAATSVAIDSLLPSPPVPMLPALLWYVIFVTAGPVLIGRLVRGRSRLVAELQKQRTALLAEREGRVSQAVTAERQRIAAQLRDVVTSSVDLVIAEVAVVEADRGDKGLAALVRIEVVARKVLGEMRRLFEAFSGQDADTRPASPDPLRSGPTTHAGHRVLAIARKVRAVLSRAPWSAGLAGLMLFWFEAEVQGLVPRQGPRALISFSLIAVAAPLAWSHRRPLLAAATCLVALVTISRFLIPIPATGASAILALYLPFSVGAFSGGRKAVAGLVVCGMGLIAAFGLQGAPALAFFATGPWLAGRLLSDRIRLAEELESTILNLAHERDLRAAELVLEERLRVARELHDVIGHTLMVVVLQAGAARRNWATDNARTARAVGFLAEVARTGLTELLGSLKALDDPSRWRPATPGLADIRALVEQARAAGIRVELMYASLPAALKEELQLTAYRVVQEGLTNVMKHAPGCSTQVRIGGAEDRLQVEVVNSGPLPSRLRRGSRSGQGLTGMARRVAASGGELTWGRDEAGGFAVQARLPVLI